MKFQIQKNKICFENGANFLYTKEMVKRFSLFERQELGEEEYEAFVRYRMQLSSYTWLSKRDYFAKELEQKLIREYGNKIWARELLALLQEQGYLDDYSLACAWIRNKKYGKQKLSFLLSQKGVDKGLIVKALEEAYPNPGEEIRKIWKKLGNKEKEKKIMALLRKGYNYSEIKKAISEEEE